MVTTATEHSAIRYETGQATDRGQVRPLNEDSYFTRPETGIWLVADGMGGHSAGDFASQTIANAMASIAAAPTLDELQARFLTHLQVAHDHILQHALQLGGGTVGATLVALLVHENHYACIWSGDSRLYLMRDGVMTRLTRDHTEVQQLIDSGALSEEEARLWPRKNVITRAIGVFDTPEHDILAGQVQPGDVFLLCSDGLTEHLDDLDLQDFLISGANDTPQVICNALIWETLERGARDNVTAVILRCAGGDSKALDHV